MYDNPDTKRFYTQYQPWMDTFAIHMRIGKTMATSINLQEYTPGVVSPPLLDITRDEAQQLIDKLYEVGLRPSLAAGTAGQLEAVKYHLEDMRKLALKL